MTLARLLRFAGIIVALSIIIWSFAQVLNRASQSYAAVHNRPVTLTFLYWGDTSENEIITGLLDRFEFEHPTVRILRINPGAQGFPSKLRTMTAAGTPPDVFYMLPSDIPTFASQKLLAPLDSMFSLEPVEWQQDVFPVLLENLRYDLDTRRVGSGTLFALPKEFSTAGFYVNLDLFERAGVSVPYNGWTWDQFELVMKKISALNQEPDFADRRIYGGHLHTWAMPLRNILWTYGGDFFGAGGFRDLALDSPQSLQALQMICRTRLVDKTIYNPTGVGQGGIDEFYNGNVGCTGPIGRWMTPRYKSITRFRWDVVPVPHQTTRASQIYITALSVSSQTPHPVESFELIRFLCGQDAQAQQARLGAAVPCLKSVASSADYLNPPGLPHTNAKLYTDALSYARLQVSPTEPAWDRFVNDDMARSLQLGQEAPEESAIAIRKAWIGTLDSPLLQHSWPLLHWPPVLAFTIAVSVAGALLLWAHFRRARSGGTIARRDQIGLVYVVPWLLGFVVLTLGPLLVSLLLSFSKWSALTPLLQAEWVGTANYRQIMGDASFFQALKVTAYYVVLFVPLYQIAGLMLAMLLNSSSRGLALFRTVYFIPSAIGGTALSIIWIHIFDGKYGVLNAVLAPVTRLVGLEPPDWFGIDASRYAVPGLVLMGLWGVGGGMLIYLGGLKGISTTLYEAAAIDGAGHWRRFWNITVPMISPLILFNVVMGLIIGLQVFAQVYVFAEAVSNQSTLVYGLYIYRQAFEYHNMGYASALAWFLFAVTIILTLFILAIFRRFVNYDGIVT